MFKQTAKMASISTADAQEIVPLFAERAAKGSAELDDSNCHTGSRDPDEENDNKCTIFDSFYSTRGSATIYEMINFNTKQFKATRKKFPQRIKSFHIVREAIKSRYIGKDCF